MNCRMCLFTFVVECCLYSTEVVKNSNLLFLLGLVAVHSTDLSKNAKQKGLSEHPRNKCWNTKL